MKYFELDPQELEILKNFEDGNFKSIDNFQIEKEKYKKYAKANLNKTRNINIRISEADLLKIKSKAVEEGIPYQTLISSLLHKYSQGRLQPAKYQE